MEFLTANFAPIMFAGLICFLLLGFPVAFSLGACGLTFGIIGIELGDQYFDTATKRIQEAEDELLNDF